MFFLSRFFFLIYSFLYLILILKEESVTENVTSVIYNLLLAIHLSFYILLSRNLDFLSRKNFLFVTQLSRNNPLFPSHLYIPKLTNLGSIMYQKENDCPTYLSYGRTMYSKEKTKKRPLVSYQ